MDYDDEVLLGNYRPCPDASTATTAHHCGTSNLYGDSASVTHTRQV